MEQPSNKQTFKISEKVSIVVELSNDYSLDEFLGLAEVIKKIKKSVDNLGDSNYSMRKQPKKRFGFWTSDKIQELIKMTKQKIDTDEIAKHFDSTKATIYGKQSDLRKLGKL